MGRLMRELEIGAVPLAFRSSFRDWAANAPRRPGEPYVLAQPHVDGDHV